MASSLIAAIGVPLLFSAILLQFDNKVFVESEDFVPSYLKIKVPPTKGRNTYYGPDGFCGWWNGTGYEKPFMNYTNSLKLVSNEASEWDEGDANNDGNGNDEQQHDGDGKVSRDKEEKGKFCLYEFHRAAMQPLCGDPFYMMVKYCAMVEFFKNQLPAPLQGDEADMMLMLVDGCVLCKKEKNIDGANPNKVYTVTIRLKHTWGKGSTFTSCNREENEIGSLKITANSSDYFDSQLNKIMMEKEETTGYEYERYRGGSSAQFTLQGILYQRICKGAFSTDSKADFYRGLNCGGGNHKFPVNLADITIANFVNNMVELRGLMLLLDKDNSEWFQYSMQSYNYMNSLELEDEGGFPVYSNLKDE